MPQHRSNYLRRVQLMVFGFVAGVAGKGSADDIVLQPGFQEQIVWSGLQTPTNLEFAPDGRVFVAEKGGRIWLFDSLGDTTPTLFVDLRVSAQNQGDRGLLGLAVHPQFPAEPYVYVLYTYDAPLGESVPYWQDNCSEVGGLNAGACLVSGRLARFRVEGVVAGPEEVLLDGWCQQFGGHSIGDLHFGTDGMLYVSAGDGANFEAVDYGQLGSPANACGDPPGGAMTPPAAEGGALRAQDLRTTGDPTGLSGALLRLDPQTGEGAPDNPLAASSDPNARRIVAYGFRNPFRITSRPGTSEIWIGDVGWTKYEEINRVADPTAGVTNFGWPCFEGVGRQEAYDGADLDLCEALYDDGTSSPPFFSYAQAEHVVADDGCPPGGSSISGVAFYPISGGSFPAPYQGALFFADYARTCIWAIPTNASLGLPELAERRVFARSAAEPVDLTVGPGGDLYYVSITTGTVRRIRYFGASEPPRPFIVASPTSGPAPLTVQFDATRSTGADPSSAVQLQYAWDFTDDGQVDSTDPAPSFTYAQAGSYTARLRVTDSFGAAASTTVEIQSGNSAPAAVIDTPTAALLWRVNDLVEFSGHATDPQQGELPASALHWVLRNHHCSIEGDCHIHTLQEWSGTASGSFPAPDHEYPSYLELVLTATDEGGLASTARVRLDPQTVELTFTSRPIGQRVAIGSETRVTPFTHTVIAGSQQSIGAVVSPEEDGYRYRFDTWSDGGAQTHAITATASSTWTANYITSARLPLGAVTVRRADSEETAAGPGRAVNAVDGTVDTIWHTAWSLAAPAHPHEIELDLGALRLVTSLYYAPWPVLSNGRIADYEIEVSEDGMSFRVVADGTWPDAAAEQIVDFAPVVARYVRLRALSEVGGRPWASAAEIGVGVARLRPGIVTVVRADSEETAGGPGLATHAVDGRLDTIWHTEWSLAAPPHPHEIDLDLGSSYAVSCLYYAAWPELSNGRIEDYEVYLSADGSDWGSPVASGRWSDTSAEQSACWTARSARYVRLRALSEVGGRPWASAAELAIGAR